MDIPFSEALGDRLHERLRFEHTFNPKLRGSVDIVPYCGDLEAYHAYEPVDLSASFAQLTVSPDEQLEFVADSLGPSYGVEAGQSYRLLLNDPLDGDVSASEDTEYEVDSSGTLAVQKAAGEAQLVVPDAFSGYFYMRARYKGELAADGLMFLSGPLP